ncbi:hypothetical protein PAXINDRAFT_158908, partial [Paxillus involutus ATCC 200175]
MAKMHVFEGAFVMAGSVVNQDGGLAFTFTTPGAENFFTERCRADENEIITHFKAHIYLMFEFSNRTSLVNIAHTFEDNDQHEEPSVKKEDNDDIPEAVDPEEHEDHALVRSKFVQALACLLASTTPVIHGAAPDYDSLQLRGKRMFVNLKCDNKGLPWKPNVAATCIKKPASQPSTPPMEGPPCSPSIHDSDGIEEVPGPSVEKQPTRIWKKPEVVIMCTSKSSKKIAVDSESGDLSSASGSEYQPGEGDVGVGKGSEPDETPRETDASEYERLPSSRKCKVITDTSSHVLKKRAAAPPCTAEAQPSKGKAKAKAQSSKHARHKRPARSPSSAPDVTPVPLDVLKECLHILVQNPGPPSQQHHLDPTTTASTSQACAELTEPVNPEDQQGDPPALPCPGPKSAEPPAATMPMDSCPPISQPPTSSANSQAIRPKPRPVTKTHVAKDRDPDDAFSLRKRRYPGNSNIVPLSAPSADLLVAEEGHLGSATLSNTNHLLESPSKTLQDNSTTAHHEPVPPQAEYNYYPLQQGAPMHYETRDSYAPQYQPPQGFAEHLPVPGVPLRGMQGDMYRQPQDNGHGDFNERMQYTGRWYGSRSPDARFQPYLDRRATGPPPYGDMAGYYYRSQPGQPNSQFHALPAVHRSPYPNDATMSNPQPYVHTPQAPKHPIKPHSEATVKEPNACVG